MNSTRRYFTLIEMLITISILAFIMIVASSVLSYIYHVRQAYQAVTTEVLIDHNIMSLIENDVRSCQWLDDSHPLIFKLESDAALSECSEFHMVGFFKKKKLAKSEDDPITYSWINEVSYVIHPNDNDNYYSLLRRTQSGFDKNIKKGGGWELVFGRITSFQVLCFDGKEWVEKWDSAKKKALPPAVEVIIRIPYLNENEEYEDKEIRRKIFLFGGMDLK